MKRIIKHERIGEITYAESFWTGKKSLFVNGQALNRTAKNVFQTAGGETITLKGNFFTGTSAVIGTETVVLTPSYKWYDYLLSLIPFIFIIVWGNTLALCQIVPVVGGAIGGAISGLFIALNFVVLRVLNFAVIKKAANIPLKILITIAMAGICFLICYLIALAMLAIW